MDEQQPKNQTMFRPNTGLDDAFVVLECLSSKSLEWKIPIWFANLVLTKTSDRIEYSHYSPLFNTTATRCPTLLLRFVVGTLQETNWFSSWEGKVHH